MTVMELKKYVFENTKIEYVLNELGCHNIKFHDNKNYYSACFPDGDNPQGINIRNTKNLNYRSFSRGIEYDDGKDLISLIENIKEYSFLEAIKYLHKLFNLTYHWKKESKPIEKKETPVTAFEKYCCCRNKVNTSDIQFINEDLLDDYIPLLHIDWFREGITQRTANKFGLAYSYKRKRIIIPIRYWMTKELVGINQRTTVENYNEFGIKKYFITPSYRKALNIYGLAENYKSITSKKKLTIFEAEKSVLKRDSLLDDTCVALQGKTISDEQVSIVKGLGLNEITIALDKDVNIDEVRFICEKFWNNITTYYIKDNYDLLGEKDSPVDKGKKIYDFLYKYRIKYDINEHNKYLSSLERK